VPYTLRVEAMSLTGPLESEPNDSPSTAQGLPVTKAVTAFAGARVDEVERSGVTRPDAPFSSFDYYLLEAPEGRSLLLVVVPPERGALWLAQVEDVEGRRPRAVEVRGAPSFLELKLGGRPRRVRVSAGRDTLPGDVYFLAVADADENGVAGVLDLAERLRLAGREETRRLVLEGAATRLGGSREVWRLEPPGRAGYE